MRTTVLRTLFFFVCILMFPKVAPLAQEEKPTLTYTLDECIHIAMRESTEILVAMEEINRVKGVVFEEWSSILSVSAETKYSYMGLTSDGSGLSTRVTASPDEQYNFGLYASIPLFTGGRVVSGLNIAYLQLEIAHEQYRLAVSEVVYNTNVVFYTILLAKREIEMRLEELDLLAKNVEMTRDKYYEGLVPKYDLMRIEVELNNAKPSYIRAENNLSIAYEDLKRLLGMDLDDSIDIEGELAYTETDMGLDEYLLACENENPESKISLLNERIAEKSIDVAIGGFFPSISAFANYDYSASGLDISFNDDDWEFTAGVMIEIPISELVVTMAKKKQAQAQYEQAKLTALDTVEKVKLDVKTAYFDLVEAKGIIEALEYNIELAKENLKTAQVRYDNGVGTLLELLDAQLAVTQAQLNYLEAIFNYNEALARLDRIIGRGIMEE